MLVVNLWHENTPSRRSVRVIAFFAQLGNTIEKILQLFEIIFKLYKVKIHLKKIYDSYCKYLTKNGFVLGLAGDLKNLLILAGFVSSANSH